MSILYTVDKPSKIHLDQFNVSHFGEITKEEAAEEIVKLGSELDILQEALYAAGSHSVLIVLQAMDTGGKDGTISHVFDAINPQGCSVASFKQPTPLESAHDFLWRVHMAVPQRGMMTIFNRSHYEDVLVTRVHDLVPKSIWSKRYSEIMQFETLLAQNNTIILKFYLHIDKDEQQKRLLAREEDPAKAWKLSAADWHERLFWDQYMDAYSDAIGKTASKTAPWYVVPANNKWYRNYAIASKLVEVLRNYKDEWDSTLRRIGDDRKVDLQKMRSEHPELPPLPADLKKKKNH
jgi:PPK2 family polyphosphate:nucleotide phosphotransferase